MKKLFYLFIFFLSVISFSCKKEPKKHKITYEVNFFQTPSTGSSNFIGISNPTIAGKVEEALKEINEEAKAKGAQLNARRNQKTGF